LKANLYFVDKISLFKLAVAPNTATLAAALFPDPKFSGTQLDCLSAVTFGEVYKLITSVKPKTSSVDYIPTSLIKPRPAVFSHQYCCKLLILSRGLSLNDQGSISNSVGQERWSS
jgi:hypothetical protein